jgi:hypothetical protein
LEFGYFPTFWKNSKKNQVLTSVVSFRGWEEQVVDQTYIIVEPLVCCDMAVDLNL